MKGNKTKAKQVFLAFILIGLAYTGRMFYLSVESSKMSPDLGVAKNKLTYCPQKPNCVSSLEEGDHYVEPIKSSLSLKQVKSRVLTLPRARLEEEGEGYVHFTFKSKLFGFLDDVELLKRGDVYHIRSASRVGYSDMGANRERVEMIRDLLNHKERS